LETGAPSRNFVAELKFIGTAAISEFGFDGLAAAEAGTDCAASTYFAG
jgi:hypothetical protein